MTAARGGLPFLRGPARIAEAVFLVFRIHRVLPEARLPFQRARVRTAVVAGSLGARAVRSSSHLSPLGRELVGGALALLPAMISLRGSDLTSYHGAEHVTIGSYEHGEPRTRVHERCGTTLVAPLVAGSLVASLAAEILPRRARRAGRLVGQTAAFALASELMAWALAHPDEPLSRALRRPGEELQLHLATAEPSPEQLEVARAALDACLALENESAQQG